MRKNKRAAWIISSLLVLSFVITACGGSNGGKASDAPSGNAGTSANTKTDSGNTKNVNLKVSLWGIQDGFNAPGAKEDKIFNDLQSKFNVSIDPVQITWNDWEEKLKVWAASNQLPDIFPNALAGNLGMYKTWAKQGVIKALPDDLSKYPNIKRVMALPSVQPLKVDGKFYMIPRMTYNDPSDWSLDRPILYRKDWAIEAGFTKDPESFDDLVAMTKAVMAKHPGVTGIATTAKSFLMTHFLGSFPEVVNMKSWVKEDGKWIPSYTSKKMNEGVKQLRTLYEEGLLDKDFATQKDSDGVNKFINGKIFMYFGSPGSIDPFIKANPGATVAKSLGLMKWFPAADGKRYTFTETPYWSEVYFRNDISDEKFDRALQLADYMMSEQYRILVKNGIEGTDYKMEGDKSLSLLATDQSLDKKYPITKVINVLGSWGNGFRYSGKQVISSNPEQAAFEKLFLDTYNQLKKEAVPTPINFDVMLMSTPAKDKIGNLMNTAQDELVKVILGKDDPIAMWEKAVKSFDAKGLQEAIVETNAEAAKLGIK
ncbi:extracellular solute-binding protein [Paenibacillus sp. Soil787]|uniref:extracellular solute-binding protein n=1 Tax=Paenibacillus sp. Soil787 TaxID=1736411 RepID=UPI0006FC3681|nr:extracellular solute-binding protein [Paenibacillus sp. Soil787]KRF42267.1 hypothetical protein ASG93_21470 [Paenibacillus sp. Soil787]